MQKALCLEPANDVPVIDNIKQLVETTLLYDWVVRIEYSTDYTTNSAQWQQWGETKFAVRDSTTVLDAIKTCRYSNPGRGIRLFAEKMHPQTRLLFWIYPVVEPPAQASKQVNVITGDIRKYLAPLNDGLSAARQRIWKITAIAGMLMASLLVLEEVVA